MKEVKIISLSGYISSGKDFIAQIAEEQFGYKHLKLAGLIKLNYCLINGMTLEELELRKYKEVARPELIAYGEKMKEVDLYCHCKYVYQQILKELPRKSKIVVSDLRYPYEALYFRKIGRCSKTQCEVEHKGILGYEVDYKSLYIESDLADKSSSEESESYYENYLKPKSDGIIFNGTEERYDKNRLVNQLAKFL